MKETTSNYNVMLAQLQQKVIQKVGELELMSGNWERSFLVNNDMSLPIVNNRKEHLYAANIFRRFMLGKVLLKYWNIAF